MARGPLRVAGTLAALAMGVVQCPAMAEPSELPPPFAYNYGEVETPRGAAMAGAVRALGNGTTAALLNPAGMGLAQLYHIAAFGQWTPEAARQVYGGAIVDTTRRFSGGVGLFGGFMDPDGADRSFIDVRISLAYLIAKEFSLGLNGRYLNLDQEGQGALGPSRASGGLMDPDDAPSGRSAVVNTMTLDAGIVIRPTEGFHIGVVGQNLSYPNNGFLPTAVGGGIGYGTDDFSVEADGVADFNSWQELSGRVMAGGEYLIGDRVPVRLGYRFDEGAGSHAISGGLGYLDPRFSVEASVRRTLVGPSATMIVVSVAYHLESSGLIGFDER